MISREDIQRLIHRPPTDKQILSLFLDMSVNSDNKRTYSVFLNKQRGRFPELDSDREGHHTSDLGAAFERLGRWIDDRFEEQNKGLALYTELGGDWVDGLQFPVPVANRLEVADRPIVGPLAEVVERHAQHAVFLVDREHFRMLLLWSGVVLQELEVETEPTEPRRHAIQAGGEAQKKLQNYKAEEVRHFFKEFAQEAAEFDRRFRPADIVLLGQEETVKNFLDFLPQGLQGKVVHTGSAAIGTPAPAVADKLLPFYQEMQERREAKAVQLLTDRVRNRHLATSGVQHTLEQLQEGKVETLVVARDFHREGSQCQHCGFYLVRRDGGCPYCGGEIRDGIDVVEAMIRIAAEQEVPIEFADSSALAGVNGTGALLKF